MCLFHFIFQLLKKLKYVAYVMKIVAQAYEYNYLQV